ncbi:TPA_asm: description family protein, partial [Salmonella enterica subsp. enterica serovar Heidelberg]|nr:description family protein [Salmonella enterica subsp. enterica serovar Typhimurium]HAE9781700.1 description family protein [Salmonella enterica subsp. enterica serovar Heidelberg]
IAKITDRVERIIAEDDDADGEYIKGLIEIEYERNKKL